MPLPTTMASSLSGTFSAENTEGKGGRHREGTPQHMGDPRNHGEQVTPRG